MFCFTLCSANPAPDAQLYPRGVAEFYGGGFPGYGGFARYGHYGLGYS